MNTEHKRKLAKFWEDVEVKGQALDLYRISETAKADKLLEANSLWRCPTCFSILKEPDRVYHVAYHAKGKRREWEEKVSGRPKHEDCESVASEHMHKEVAT